MLRRLALILCLVLCTAPCLPAQDAEVAHTPPLAGIAHVAIRVRNLAASIAFYQSLGYQQAFDLRHDDIPYESFIKINDRQFIELYPATAKDPNIAFLHLCFEGEDLEAIHDDYAALKKAGAGNLLFTMQGPDQPLGPGGAPIPQNIEYTQYQPGSLHSNDFGRHLGPDRVADRLLAVVLAEVDFATGLEFYVNQLSFKPLPGQPSNLHLPGGSGQQIVMDKASAGSHARILLDTLNLGHARRRLAHEHIPVIKLAENAMLVTDPDGNQIVIGQR